jgi:hypothetical protein
MGARAAQTEPLQRLYKGENMNLTVTCQTCGKVLTVVQKDQVSQQDISDYQANSFCDTVQGTGTDGDGNPITIYDGTSNIQATMTQE